jgi:hypothetical protein
MVTTVTMSNTMIIKHNSDTIEDNKDHNDISDINDNDDEMTLMPIMTK